MRNGHPIKDYSIEGLAHLLEKNFVLKNEVVGKLLKSLDHDPRIQSGGTLYITDENIVSYLAKEAADGCYAAVYVNSVTGETYIQTDEEKQNNPMTVKELIAELQELDGDGYVFLKNDANDDTIHEFSISHFGADEPYRVGDVYLCFDKEEEV